MAKLSDYLHTAAASEYLGVAQNTIRKWADRGDVKMHRHAVNGYCYLATYCDRLLRLGLQSLG
jgi:predicted site-specific integrase-resolvase